MRKCGGEKIFERNMKQGKARGIPRATWRDPQLLQIRNSFEYFRPRGREEEEEEEDNDDDEGRNWLLQLPRDVRF
jgi:hypothetical protein